MAVYQRAQAAGQPFAAVILDYTIPGSMGGLETLARLRAIDPQVTALISSGYANNPVMAEWAYAGFQWSGDQTVYHCTTPGSFAQRALGKTRSRLPCTCDFHASWCYLGAGECCRVQDGGAAMAETNKTKAQLLKELAALRRRNAQLAATVAAQWAEDRSGCAGQ